MHTVAVCFFVFLGGLVSLFLGIISVQYKEGNCLIVLVNSMVTVLCPTYNSSPYEVLATKIIVKT